MQGTKYSGNAFVMALSGCYLCINARRLTFSFCVN